MRMICTPTLREVIIVKIVRITINFFRSVSHWVKSYFVVECQMKLLPRYMGILKHHLVNKLEIKHCTSVLFEVLRSLDANQRAVCTVRFVHSALLLLSDSVV